MEIRDRREYANKVLVLVKRGIRKMYKKKPFLGSDDWMSIGSYQNGREQGYSIRFGIDVNPNCPNLFGKMYFWVAFSEYRTSDAVVVYVDERDPCTMISDSSCEHASFFNYRESKPKQTKFEAAAEFILSLVKRMKKGEQITSENAKPAKPEKKRRRSDNFFLLC